MKWETGALWLKAKLYIDRANEIGHEQREFPLWSALALELLARAALTGIHPALNADPREDTNLLYAFGFEIVGQPRSLPVHSVYLRLEKTVKGFGKLQRELCDYMALLRNEELHGGDLPFQGIKESMWLPRFYEVCKILCASHGKTLEDFLGSDVAESAEKLIRTLNKERESSIRGKIAAHAKVFGEKVPEEQKRMRDASETSVKLLPHNLKSESCPSCASKGVLRGELFKELKPKYEEGVLLVEQEYLASEFKCLTCNLVLHSLEEIVHAGIEPRFSAERATELHELFEPEYDDEYMNM